MRIEKSCHVRQYLNYKNCIFRKKLTDKLFKEFSKDISGNEMIHNVILNNYGKVWSLYYLYYS